MTQFRRSGVQKFLNNAELKEFEVSIPKKPIRVGFTKFTKEQQVYTVFSKRQIVNSEGSILWVTDSGSNPDQILRNVIRSLNSGSLIPEIEITTNYLR